MLRIKTLLGLFGALTLWLLLPGCGGETKTPTITPPSSGTNQSVAPGAALGILQAAGPFQVLLTTVPSSPKVGETKFIAKVTKDEQPLKAGTVVVSLSMPSMSMAGPEIKLKAAGDHFEGAGNLAMGGEYEAKTTVSAGAVSGAAVFRFTASQ